MNVAAALTVTIAVVYLVFLAVVIALARRNARRHQSSLARIAQESRAAKDTIEDISRQARREMVQVLLDARRPERR